MVKTFHAGAKLNQNRYQIEAQYKEGGQAFIYIATDLISNAPVVIKQNKISEKSYHDAIDQERKILTGLDHPLLPKIYDFFNEQGYFFLVMSYIVGKDLDSLATNKKKPFSSVEVIGWIAQLLDILKYLQQQDSLVHGDIKPKNIRLGENDNIYLLDFGVTSKNGSKNAFVIAQSPNYASPEQLKDEVLSFASDIYSLGATAYYLLTRHPPENALIREEALQKKSYDPLIPIIKINPEVPVKFAQLVERALSIDASYRPKNAYDMYLQLQESLETNISERLDEDEDETVISPRDPKILKNTKIFFPLNHKLSKNLDEKMFLPKDAFSESRPTAKFFAQDATVEALHLIHLSQKDSPILKKLAHVIVKVMDSSPAKRKDILNQFSGVFNNFPLDKTFYIITFLNKLADYSICDPEIEQQLRSSLGNILIANLGSSQGKNNESPIETAKEIESLQKLNYDTLTWIGRGIVASVLISLLLCLFFNDWLNVVPTSLLIGLLIIEGIVGSFLNFALNQKRISKQFLTSRYLLYITSFFFGVGSGCTLIFMFLRLLGVI